MGGDRGGEDVIHRNLRQQFALQIAHPVALEFLRAAETYDPTSGVVASEPRTYDSFFAEGAKPSAEVVAFVNDAARKRGRDLGKLHGVPFALKDIYATAGIRSGRPEWGSVRDAAARPSSSAVAIAQIAHSNAWASPVEGALFFHAAYVSPGWKLRRVGRVDNHVFYR
mgnify:CR=1 FL=1